MNRLTLFLVLLFQSTVVFCQSVASLPGSPQVPGNASFGQGPINFSGGQFGQTFSSAKSGNTDFRDGLCQNRNQTSAHVDVKQRFHVSVNPDSILLMLAQNNSLPSSFLNGRNFGYEPIPTQWPNAKIEQIPTQWPNLKLQPIDGGSPGLVLVHRGAK